MNTPVLKYPNINKEFILDTNASFKSIGVVRSQNDNVGHRLWLPYNE